jgi:hypothetical protein
MWYWICRNYRGTATFLYRIGRDAGSFFIHIGLRVTRRAEMTSKCSSRLGMLLGHAEGILAALLRLVRCRQ